MTNDVIRLACEQAAESFGSSNTFNAACFSHCLMKIAGLKGSIDGRLVRALLTGRDDIQVLPGSAHYKIKWEDSDDD